MTVETKKNTQRKEDNDDVLDNDATRNTNNPESEKVKEKEKEVDKAGEEISFARQEGKNREKKLPHTKIFNEYVFFWVIFICTQRKLILKIMSI